MDIINFKKRLYKFLENEDKVDLEIDKVDELLYFEEIKGTGKKNSSNIYRPYNYKINSEFEKTTGFLGIPASSKYEVFCFFL